MTTTKTVEQLNCFKDAVENSLMDLWAAGTAGATKVSVVNVGWTISLALKPRWVLTLGNVDRQVEQQLMKELNMLMRQSIFGKDDMDVYTEWADEPTT